MLAEVAAPVVPEFAGLIVALTLICATLVAIGILMVLQSFANAVVGGIGQLLGRIPGIGAVLSSPVNAVVHWMGSVFGEAEQALDAVLARFLHELGTLIAWTMYEIRDTSKLLYTLAKVTLGTAAFDAIERSIKWLEGRIHAAELRIGAFETRLLHVAEAEEGRVLRWVEPRLHALEHTVEGVIDYDLAALRARARSITDALDALFQRLRRYDALLGTAAITGAVAIALSRLDLSWVRCRNWNRLGKTVCGIPFSLLDDLLGLSFAFLEVVDPEALAEAALVLEGEISGIIDGIAL